MSVDELIFWASIGAVFHDVTEAVEGEKDGRPISRGDFFPEGEEDWPGDFGVTGAELSETGERDI